MKLSVIVPAFNEARGIADTLASIHAASRAFVDGGVDWELIVCDNNSTDTTAAIAAAAGARVVFEPINQIARARNTGAAHASGEWLLFIDADSHPTPELCADLVQAARSDRCLGGGATVRVDAAEARGVRLIVAAWNIVSGATRWAAGSFLFCRADAFAEVGGFNTELFIAEDVDLSIRLKALARTRHQRLEILRRHPLRTSARKAHLYTVREFVSFYWRVVATGGRVMRRPDACGIWYDGRR